MSDEAQHRRKKALAQVRLAHMKEAAVWQKAFGTPDGEKCLLLLRKSYYDIDHIANNDSIITQNRAAQRDLVAYIIRQMEYTGEE